VWDRRGARQFVEGRGRSARIGMEGGAWDMRDEIVVELAASRCGWPVVGCFSGVAASCSPREEESWVG
jgi:hypothetical protein